MIKRAVPCIRASRVDRSRNWLVAEASHCCISRHSTNADDASLMPIPSERGLLSVPLFQGIRPTRMTAWDEEMATVSA
jgi:hypothetical protein